MHVRAVLLTRHGKRFVGNGLVLKEDEVGRMVDSYRRWARHGRLVLTFRGLEYDGDLETEFPVQQDTPIGFGEVKT